MKNTLFLLAFLFSATVALAQTKPANYSDLIKGQLKKDKTEMVSQLLGVNIDPNSDFGKLYGEFQGKLLDNGEKRFKLINEYLNRTNNITPEFANSLVKQYLDNDAERTKIMRKYSKKLGKYLSPQNTLALMQFENKLRSVVDAELAKMIPFANF